MGQLIAAGVLEGLVGRSDEWSYRIPFGRSYLPKTSKSVGNTKFCLQPFNGCGLSSCSQSYYSPRSHHGTWSEEADLKKQRDL